MVFFSISFNDLTKKGLEWYAAVGRIKFDGDDDNSKLPDRFQLGLFDATHVKHEVLETLKELLDKAGVPKAGIDINSAKNGRNKRHTLLFKDLRERIKRLQEKNHDVLKKITQQIKERQHET